jgi:hypothetical protein
MENPLNISVGFWPWGFAHQLPPFVALGYLQVLSKVKEPQIYFFSNLLVLSNKYLQRVEYLTLRFFREKNIFIFAFFLGMFRPMVKFSGPNWQNIDLQVSWFIWSIDLWPYNDILYTFTRKFSNNDSSILCKK